MHHAHVFPYTHFALKTILYFQCQALHNVHIMVINKAFVYVRHACTLVMGLSRTSVLMFLRWSPSATVGLLFNENTFGPWWKAKSLCHYCDYSEWQSGANLSSLFTSTPPALQGGSPGHTHECAFVLRERVCACVGEVCEQFVVATAASVNLYELSRWQLLAHAYTHPVLISSFFMSYSTNCDTSIPIS